MSTWPSGLVTSAILIMFDFCKHVFIWLSEGQINDTTSWRKFVYPATSSFLSLTLERLFELTRALDGRSTSPLYGATIITENQRHL